MRIAREADDQKALAQLLDSIRVDGRPILWCHVPNEGRRDKLYAIELRRRGVKPGVPDVLIFDPPPECPFYAGMAIEMKTRDGTLNNNQKAWLDGLSNLGWLVAVCYGIDEAIRALRETGYLRGGARHGDGKREHVKSGGNAG